MVEPEPDASIQSDGEDAGPQRQPVSILVEGGARLKGMLGKANMASPLWKGAAGDVGSAFGEAEEKEKEWERSPSGHGVQGWSGEKENMTAGKEGVVPTFQIAEETEDEKKAGKERNPFSHVIGSKEFANQKKKKPTHGTAQKEDTGPASSSASAEPATNPLTAALLQSMRRRSSGGVGPGGRERKGSMGILCGTKDLLRQLNTTASSKAMAPGGASSSLDHTGLQRKSLRDGGNPEDSSGSSDNDSQAKSEEGEIPIKDAPAPYVASVGNVRVKHRERSSAVSFSDQFPDSHSCSSHGRMDSITTEGGRSSFLSWSTSEPVFLPRVKLGKQRILRF